VPNLEHLRVLGAPCVVRVPHPQGNLAPRGQQSILLGYLSDGRSNTFVYRVCITADHTSVQSLTVHVDERPYQTEHGPGGQAFPNAVENLLKLDVDTAVPALPACPNSPVTVPVSAAVLPAPVVPAMAAVPDLLHDPLHQPGRNGSCRG
jgi:hypothetical protein